MVLRIESAPADADAIRGTAQAIAAERDAGYQVVAVAPAGPTAEQVDLAHDLSRATRRRELEMLAPMAERTTCGFTPMALRDLGYEAVSLTGIVTDATHGGTRVVGVRPERVHEVRGQRAIALVDADATTGRAIDGIEA